MRPQRALRIAFGLAVGLAILVLAIGLVSAAEPVEKQFEVDAATAEGPVAPPRHGTTVVATDSTAWHPGREDGAREHSEILAIAPNGSLLYTDRARDQYWDVDPVSNGTATVEYAYSDHLRGPVCERALDHEDRAVDPATWAAYAAVRNTSRCSRNGIERVNLTTGERTRVWSTLTPGYVASRYHDADRLDAHRFVVADIYLDRVFVVNATSDRITWTWNASDAFPTATGGPHPMDWTHLNDVEVLPDGGFRASLRNLDQVAYLDRSGLVRSRTLGGEEDHGTLYEQHNPDHIRSARGGPAVLVSDSENNRIVEYQREGASWNRTWHWQDGRTQWPRDADRLPNGHTLVTDSHGNRVFEVDADGRIAWSVPVGFPYEAERLGTGEESAGGPSARAAGLDTRTAPAIDGALVRLKGLFPGKYLNGVVYVTPIWMGFAELLALAVGLLAAIAWAGTECYWAVRRGWRPGGWLPGRE